MECAAREARAAGSSRHSSRPRALRARRTACRAAPKTKKKHVLFQTHQKSYKTEDANYFGDIALLPRTCERSELATPSENIRHAIKDTINSYKKAKINTKNSKPTHIVSDPKPTLFDWFRQNKSSAGPPVVRDGRSDRFFEKHPNKIQINMTSPWI